jgi:hypothetical protein
MHRPTLIAVIAAATPAILLLAACGEQRTPTEATRAGTLPAAINADALPPGHSAAIVAHDACDPATFNAAFGPTTCLKAGGTVLPDFVAQVSQNHSAKGWGLTPENATARFGVDILGNNVGGEVHTFTAVRQFGDGSIFGPLNQVLGDPVVANECLQLDPDDLVPSGGKYAIEAEKLASVVDGDGIARVQCCIHPWMRTEVRLKGAAL